MGTGGNVFELFDVSLTEGSVAPPFQVPDVVSELALCQRYYQVLLRVAFLTTTTPFTYPNYFFPTPMRITPTVFALPDDTAMTGMTFQASTNSMFMDGAGVKASVSGGIIVLKARL